MINSIPDKEYRDISEKVYSIEDNEVEETFPINQNKFKLIASENNIINGMKAEAVAPVDSNGEVEI